MKYIKTKKVFERLGNEGDDFENLFELSSSFFYNLSLFKKLYEESKNIQFSDDDMVLNEELQNHIKLILDGIETLASTVVELREELRM